MQIIFQLAETLPRAARIDVIRDCFDIFATISLLAIAEFKPSSMFVVIDILLELSSEAVSKSPTNSSETQKCSPRIAKETRNRSITFGPRVLTGRKDYATISSNARNECKGLIKYIETFL